MKRYEDSKTGRTLLNVPFRGICPSDAVKMSIEMQNVSITRIFLNFMVHGKTILFSLKLDGGYTLFLDFIFHPRFET